MDSHGVLLGHIPTLQAESWGEPILERHRDLSEIGSRAR